jgi:hypothetical protein
MDPKSIAQSYDDSALKVKSIMSKTKESVPGEGGNEENPATAR